MPLPVAILSPPCPMTDFPPLLHSHICHPTIAPLGAANQLPSCPLPHYPAASPHGPMRLRWGVEVLPLDAMYQSLIFFTSPGSASSIGLPRLRPRLHPHSLDLHPTSASVPRLLPLTFDSVSCAMHVRRHHLAPILDSLRIVKLCH